MFELTGKRALVCGSTQGIGRACALVLARQGASVTLVGRDEAALHAVRAAIQSGGAHCDYLVADFSQPERLAQKAAAYTAKTGPLEILINNTGGPPSGPITEATPEQFQRAFQMHVICNQLLVQTLLPGMKERGYGRIINIISTSVKQPIPGLGVSNTIRAAVASWAKTLAGEVGPFGITVNNVLPGFTATARLKSLFEARAARGGARLEDIERQAQSEIPVRRFAQPEEIAAGVAFLASPAASYITGINLPIDGGRLSAL
jgi:3-oxoacyl-[acyl-carrier protein] reductase